MHPTIYMEKRGGGADGDEDAFGIAGPDGLNAEAPAQVRLEYVKGASNVYVRGPVSGRPYSFVHGSGGTLVDPRDVESLMVTGLFQRVGMRTGT